MPYSAKCRFMYGLAVTYVTHILSSLVCTFLCTLSSYNYLNFLWHTSHWQGCSLLWTTGWRFRRVRNGNISPHVSHTMDHSMALQKSPWREHLATRFTNYYAFHYFFFHTDITMSYMVVLQQDFCCIPLTAYSTYFFFQFFSPHHQLNLTPHTCTLLLVSKMESKQTIWWEYFTTIPAYILTTAVFFEMLCFHFDPAFS